MIGADSILAVLGTTAPLAQFFVPFGYADVTDAAAPEFANLVGSALALLFVWIAALGAEGPAVVRPAGEAEQPFGTAVVAGTVYSNFV